MSVKSTSINRITIPLIGRTNRTDLTNRVTSLLDEAGIRIGGDEPWDINVFDSRFFARVLADGSLGLGESYMYGWWQCESLDEFIVRLIKAELNTKVKVRKDLFFFFNAKIRNQQSGKKSFKVGKQHYDISTDLYRYMLDSRMIYSCGYWKSAATLDDAQQAKLDLVGMKLGLQSGMRIVDIGCGWGGSAKYLAEKYGVEVVGITISEEQAKLAQKVCQGLPIDIRLMDYRNLNGKFDRAYSIGMFEHVGYKNYSTYMEVVSKILTDDGMFLLHSIGANYSQTRNNLWVERYIFPNSMRPSLTQISKAVENLFIVEDVQNFGPDYDKTLMTWFRNFDSHWDELKAQYNERFYRMWKYYLLSFAGAFRARENQVWQIVLSKRNRLNRFDSAR